MTDTPFSRSAGVELLGWEFHDLTGKGSLTWRSLVVSTVEEGAEVQRGESVLSLATSIYFTPSRRKRPSCLYINVFTD